VLGLSVAGLMTADLLRRRLDGVGRGDQGGGAGTLPRRSGIPVEGLWRALRARARRPEGPEEVLRPRRRAARPVASRRPHLRRDRRRVQPGRSGHPGARRRVPPPGRRRDRPGLHAGHGVRPSGRIGAGAEIRGPRRQHRFGGPRRAARRCAGRRGFPAQPHRGNPGPDRRDRGGARADPGRAGRPGIAGARGRGDDPTGQALPRRPDPRPDPLRLYPVGAALPRSAPPLSRHRAFDGHGQPHRADRRRHDRGQRRADGHRVGAGDPQRAGGAGQRA
jgi:hypothetical protein